MLPFGENANLVNLGTKSPWIPDSGMGLEGLITIFQGFSSIFKVNGIVPWIELSSKHVLLVFIQ